MDKVTHYRQVIKEIIHQHSHYSPSQKDCDTLGIIDEASDNYLLVDVGWYDSKRTHFVILHLRIVEQKIYVEWDGLESGVTRILLDKGVPKDDIILGFIRPEKRDLIDFSLI
ncbi:MAG: XisI protein [Microcystis sp.]|uniref:XisI protein n=1 Tax=Microcystis sp. TaxID=1127 RepID=UPI00391CDC82